MAKTQTKTEVRNATAQIGKLLRGIDNSTQVILRDKKKLEEKITAVQKDAKTVQTLISNVSNTALAAMDVPAAAPAKKAVAPAKPAPAKPAPTKKAAAPAKPAVKPAAAKKPAAKKPAPAKPAAKPAAKKPDGKAHQAVVPGDRPALKQVITDLLAANGPMAAPDIYKAAVAKHGYWSRQSLYNGLKDTSLFLKDGEKYRAAGRAAAAKKDEADAFVEQVESNAATAHVS